ncbi:unnamed protein product [Kuraishia capsulata CBS 1993]|uniref:Pre-mRNA-splicing factor PRP46 n=1 Tax=Kuraishia capsulata CBS 1993 TaxID=1382522 RepID=W6MPM5_9ASCO|nr:uncharacterized protein KUCA_T00004653001 [Kuraishia capsulata CBS 1993]CDK28669.1 unnamed protein product [Kuraishia capsulata CBS 1993]
MLDLSNKRKILFDPEIAPHDDASNKLYVQSIIESEYAQTRKLPRHLQDKIDLAETKNNGKGQPLTILDKLKRQKEELVQEPELSVNADLPTQRAIQELEFPEQDKTAGKGDIEEITQALVLAKDDSSNKALVIKDSPFAEHDSYSLYSRALQQKQQEDTMNNSFVKPEWHAPWKLMRVIAGHTGWVRSVTVEPENDWFATGSSDGTIKIWDLASGKLRLTLTGHIMAVRGLVVSDRHPYMFSCSEDKTVKCWDLEKNKVVRDYHGHLSSVYSIDLHPSVDLLTTAGRDSSVRVWDVRTKNQIHVLTGHKASVMNVRVREDKPHIISTSMDSTVRLFDMAAGKTLKTLTHHRKAVRGLTLHDTDNTFATASSDAVKFWTLPEGEYVRDFSPRHNAIINTLSVNRSNVMFSGADNGTMAFWDWKSGHKFQELTTTKLPGSIESENGIFASAFDRSGLRLITGEADKSIKVWREDPNATPESHPGIPWTPPSATF